MNDYMSANCVPLNGRSANDNGFFLNACPYPLGSSEREQWMSDWNDAQIDRELWEDENSRRAHSAS